MLIHCSEWAGGWAVCRAEVPVSHLPGVGGTWSFFRVIRFLLSKDTASQQARAQVKRVKILVSIVPTDLRL